MKHETLLDQIDDLRLKLHRLIHQKQENLLDPGVLQMSQQLDRLILLAYTTSFDKTSVVNREEAY